MDTQPTIPIKWTTAQKGLFRFVAVYLLIYIFPFPLNYNLDDAWQTIGSLFDPFVNWVGHDILHLQQNLNSTPNGSGDTTYYYVQEFIFIALSVIATAVWAIADRRRNNYTKQLYWLKMLVRYYLAYVLLDYGFAKFNGGQFPAPNLTRLMEPYGKSSPMGLAWTFLGFSKAYGFFLGISECAGGVLMLFRRTTLFGACIATTVVTNIVMVNFCYDVPVKIFSAHLLLMCLFVLCTEGSRFVNLFLFNKPAMPVDLSPVFQARKWKLVRIVAKVIVLVALIGFPIFGKILEVIANSDGMKPPLYGIYVVNEFTKNNQLIPPLATDSTRWARLIVNSAGYATVQAMTERYKAFVFRPDTVHNTITMYPTLDTAIKYHLSYKKEDSTLCLYGMFEKDSMRIKLQRYNEQKYLLINRGFHWVNEFPFNR